MVNSNYKDNSNGTIISDIGFKSLFDNNVNILLIFEKATGKILYANKAACEYYQYSYDELTSLNIRNINILSETDIKKEIEKAYLEKRKYFNFIHRLANNDLRRVEVSASPVTVDGKECLFLIVTDAINKNSQQLMIADLFYESPNAMVIINDEKKVLTINKSFTKLFGYHLHEIEGKLLKDFVMADDSQYDVILNIERVLKGEVVNKNSVRKTKNNQLIDVNIIATPYVINNNIIGALILYNDITEQLKLVKEIEEIKHKAHEELKESKDNLQLLLDSTVEGIYGMDINGLCTFCNASGLKMLGFANQDELLGKNIHDIIHYRYSDGNPMPIDECKTYIALKEGRGVYVDTEVFWRKDGTPFDVEYYSYPQFKDGKVVGAVITFIDNTEKKKHEENIIYLSYHDYLTGLYNRKYFEEAMIRMDTKDNLPISIIFGDVNGLKLTNDIFGHSAGDHLLKTASQVLKNVCRKDDIVARVGGDEFAILLPKTNERETFILLGKIKTELSKQKINAIKGSISLGFMTKVHVEDDLEKIMEIAEDWMYKDKISNRKNISSEMIKDIIDTLHKRSDAEKRHSINVSKIAKQIAEKLNLPETEVRKIKDAAFYHDIGKIVLDENVLKKNSPFNDKEKKEFEQHPVIGYRILNLFDDTLDLAEGVLYHHENWNGTGYPKGISGNEISLIARIIRIAEAYESMITEKKMNVNDVLVEIKKQSGIKYDPELTKILLEIVSTKMII